MGNYENYVLNEKKKKKKKNVLLTPITLNIKENFHFYKIIFHK